MITFIDEKGTEHSALVAYSVTNAVNGELSVKGTIYTNDKVLHGIGRGWRFRLDDEYYRITYAKPNDTGRQIEVEFDAVHQFFYDMSKSMVYTTLNGSKPFETYLQAIFLGSGYTYNLETTVGSIRKENFGNKSRISLFNDIIKAAGLEFSVRGHVVRILKRVGTDLSAIVRKNFNMNELKIEKNINSFVTYQRGLGAWKNDEDHSKGRYESEYESPLAKIYGRIEAEPVVDERYKETGKLLERLKENVDKSYKVSVEIDMEDLSRAGYRLSRPNPGDYIMAINETLGFRQKVRIVSFTSEYDVGGNLISRKVVCNDIGTVQRATSEISHLSRTLTDSIEGSERALRTATKALVSADGKNTNYFGDVKPLDVPKGTLRKGDRLFLTVGDKKQLYFWNGAEWELEPTEFDHEKFDMEFNRKSQEIKKTIQENRQKAEEALQNAGASTLLAQEAKRIGLDSIAKLEEFKTQATSAQMALSGDLDALKRTVANDIRPKQAQAEAEIAKQVEALIQTKNELAGVKSAQATYEETTTRRLAELTNVADSKVSKSELVQTAEELKSKIASVQVGSSRNYFRNSRSRTFTTGDQATYDYRTFIVPDFWKNSDRFKRDYVHISFDVTFPIALARDMPAMVHFSAHPWYSYKNLVFKGGTTERQHFEFTIDLSSSSETYQTNNVFIRFGTNYGFPAGLQVIIENAMLSVGNYFPAYQPAYEDQEDRVSVVESNFRQRADALDAGVNRLTEGLRTKADISSLNVTAENIRQSVKSLETNTQNKLDQMLSLAEFEVRAGSIRQEILNATKDKADKTLVIAEAGKLREEFSSLRVGGTNLLKGSKGPFLPDRKPANFDNNFLYSGQTSIYMEQGQKYIISAKTNGNFTAHHDGNKESDNVVLWIMDKNVRNYQIVSDLKTGTIGTKFIWNNPTGIYHLRVNTYHKEATKSVWDVKIEKGNVATDWSPAPEDTDGLITEAKATFERTVQGLRTDLSSIQEYVGQDGQRQEALRRYTREESARQATAVRELVAREYVGKSTYQEDVRGIERKFEAITNPQNGSIATQIAKYKTAVDGRFTEITSMISGKTNQTDFQRVKETSQLYERILGNTNNSIVDNVARMAMTSQLFQVEVSKAAKGGRNYIRNGQFKNGSKNWLEHQSVDFGLNFNYQHSKNPDNRNRPGLHFYHESQDVANFFGIQQSFAFDGVRGEKVSVSLLVSKDGGDVNSGLRVALHYIKNKGIIGQEWQSIPSPQITSKYKRFTFTFTLSDDVDNLNLMLYGEKGKTINLYVTDVQLERGSVATDYKEALEDTDEAIRTVQSQLAGSWAVQNLTSAGSIVSQINATNNQILIEAEKIRLKGKTLLDELTAIQGYFKRLFVGDASVGTLNSDIIRSNSITADKLVMDIAMARMFVSSDIFTDTLAAKEAFINKLRSVVVTATLLEGYRGRIGGFQIGTHEKDSSVYWITGQNQFSVGMSNGSGQWSQTALWVNWGNNWGYPGDYAWYVKNNGKMYCYNTAEFWNTPVIHGDLRVTGHIYYNNKDSGKSGYWIHSSKYSNFEPSDNYLYLYYSGSGYDWIPMNKEISDRRYKHNIEDSTVSGLDVIQKLKTYSYRKEYDGKIEDIACGIMAQDVQKYIPEAFYENPDGAYSYRTFELVPYLIKAIQELNHKIEKLEKTA